jgi:hypothetical protein
LCVRFDAGRSDRLLDVSGAESFRGPRLFFVQLIFRTKCPVSRDSLNRSLNEFKLSQKLDCISVVIDPTRISPGQKIYICCGFARNGVILSGL